MYLERKQLQYGRRVGSRSSEDISFELMAALAGSAAATEVELHRDATVPPQGPPSYLSAEEPKTAEDMSTRKHTVSSLYEFKRVGIPQHRLRHDTSKRNKKFTNYCIRVEVRIFRLWSMRQASLFCHHPATVFRVFSAPSSSCRRPFPFE